MRFKAADDEFSRLVEDTLHLLGVEGIDVPILHRGRQVFINGQPLFENKRSEMILLRIAEARFPEKYGRERFDTNVLDDDPSKWSDAQLNRILDHYLQRDCANNPVKLAAFNAIGQIEQGSIVDAEATVVETRPT